MDRDELAKAIFDWLIRSDGSGAPHYSPFTFNEDANALTIGVDGDLDCKLMADGVIRKLGLVQVRSGQRVKGAVDHPSN